MVRKTSWICCVLLGIALFVAGCGSAQKEATEAAINAAQSAINAAQAEAAKYVPDQLQAAQATLQSAKDALAKGDYQAALIGRTRCGEQGERSGRGRSSEERRVDQGLGPSMSASMPKSLDEVKTKLDAYSHGAHMPAGMDKSKLEDAKTQYEQLKQSWADASASATQGDLGDAMQQSVGHKGHARKIEGDAGNQVVSIKSRISKGRQSWRPFSELLNYWLEGLDAPHQPR